MRIKSFYTDFIMPTKGTDHAGAYDIYMPEAGSITNREAIKVPLGFAAEVPNGCVALLLPRSGVGAKHGLELNNTCGVIDSDYRDQWFAFLKTKNKEEFSWHKGERLLQFLIVPVVSVKFSLVDDLSDTSRGLGGFGSTGK